MDKKFKDNLYALLKNDSRLWGEDGKELNQTLLKDLVDKFDEKVIESLLNNSETKKQFFAKIKDAYVFKPNDFKFFLDENKIDNSFTQYANKIGLNLNDKNGDDKVILNWPFKDCILEGGMTKEDAMDVYFVYDKKTGEWKEEKSKRKEIFFNEVLARDEIDRLEEPKVLCKWERFTANGKEKVQQIKRDSDGTIKENFVIKGNNLLALYSLEKQFTGKVGVVFIDPPYYFKNKKDSDAFGYNPNFKLSAWLTFMKNRIEVVSRLLRDDGIIFIQINDEGEAYLRILMDEVFHFNFLNKIIVKPNSDYGVAHEDFLYSVSENILAFSKVPVESREKYIYQKLTGDSKFFEQYKQLFTTMGDEEVFAELEEGKVGKIKILKHKNYNIESVPIEKRNVEFYKKNIEKIIRTSNSQGAFLQKIYKKIPEKGLFSVEYKPTKGPNAGKLFRYYILDRSTILWAKNIINGSDDLSKKVIITNLWTDISWEGIAKEGGVKLRNGKKPENLLKRILDISSKEGDIVLDYHAGSGTTCAVAHKMGRQWIGIEQLDYSENNPEARMKGVIAGDKTGISKDKDVDWKGGGDFIYVQLAKWNEEAKEKIINAKSFNELVNIFDELYERFFLNYNVRAKDFKEKIIKEQEFKNLDLLRQKEIFVKMLDLNQMYVNFSERNDKKYNLSKEDIALSEEFYKRK